jgi:hypothetical protein
VSRKTTGKEIIPAEWWTNWKPFGSVSRSRKKNFDPTKLASSRQVTKPAVSQISTRPRTSTAGGIELTRGMIGRRG